MNNFEGYVLKQESFPPLLSFRLSKPEYGRIESCLIIQSPDGIIICGDLCPGRNGVIGDYKYGLKWFSGNLSPDYLCEKFLRKVWVPEAALESIQSWAVDPDLADYCPKHKEFIEECVEQDLLNRKKAPEESCVSDPRSFYDWYEEFFNDSPEDTGYDYDPRDKEILVGIQQAFSRLFTPVQGIY